MPSESALNQFAKSFQGSVLRPNEAEYDQARRVFNAMIDRRPALIARCASAQDVARSVTFAREEGLLLSVKGGGHSVAGKAVCDGGLMIDQSAMKQVEIDPKAMIAIAAPGLRLGEMDAATQQHGLATPLGIVSNTGIAGLTLGGGIGWINGKYGLACDNVIEFEVVTADGKLRRVNTAEEPDLYWALRGGSGNFGVVTSFKYRLHRVGPVLGGMVMHPATAADALRFYQEYSAGAPDEVSTAAAIVPSPDGGTVLALVACHCGDLREGERVLEPLRRFGSPLADTFGPIPYVAMQSLLDGGFPQGQLHYWKSGFTADLPADACGTLLELMATRPSSGSVAYLQQLHGAAARVPVEATAYPHRTPAYDFAFISQWSGPAKSEKNIEWTRRSFEAMQPYMDAGVYVNTLGEEGEQRVRDAYGANYGRLARIKAKYDPDNFFRMNQNIKPAAKASAAD